MPHNTGPLWTLAVKALIYVDLIETEMDKLTKNLELNSLISQCAEIQGVIAAGSLSRGCIQIFFKNHGAGLWTIGPHYSGNSEEENALYCHYGYYGDGRTYTFSNAIVFIVAAEIALKGNMTFIRLAVLQHFL